MPANPPDPVRVALVTGGARRVGRFVAMHLARLGWDVAITYHASGEAASSLAEEVGRIGRQCLIVKADLTDPDAATARVAEAVSKRFPRLDLLLHNASLYEPGGLFDATPDQMRRFFAVHAESPLLLTRRLAPLLKVANGTVIAMTDVNVDRPRPSYAAYTMSKAALANLVPSLARELAPDVTANAIAPWRRRLAGRHAGGRPRGVPEEDSARTGRHAGGRGDGLSTSFAPTASTSPAKRSASTAAGALR